MLPATKDIATTARIHAIAPRSRANGPGQRTVIWFQGCSLGCAGCFNPKTHASESSDSQAMPIDDLVADIAARFAGGFIEGLTISGGEPFEQPTALAALVAGVRAIRNGAGGEPSIIAFSGYTIDELRAMPDAVPVLSRLDALIDGRYLASRRLGAELRGSTNQEIHLMSSRYSKAEISATPELEIQIAPDGSLAVTGVAPIALGHLTRRRG